jgi:aspartate carbamoyltransferase catalytic subunit
MPVVLPGGSMVNCVRHSVLARLNADAGLPFFFPLLIDSRSPLFKGLFLPRRQEINMANPLYQKHIISINDLSREDLELVLATAAKLKANPQPELLKHKVIASCFFEASTRTRLSFETSMHRLGASVVGFSDSSNTSLGKKGKRWRIPFPSSAPTSTPS